MGNTACCGVSIVCSMEGSVIMTSCNLDKKTIIFQNGGHSNQLKLPACQHSTFCPSSSNHAAFLLFRTCSSPAPTGVAPALTGWWPHQLHQKQLQRRPWPWRHQLHADVRLWLVWMWHCGCLLGKLASTKTSHFLNLFDCVQIHCHHWTLGQWKQLNIHWV